eukprot:3336968-Pleurochrysis_carterae.AAC.1
MVWPPPHSLITLPQRPRQHSRLCPSLQASPFHPLTSTPPLFPPICSRDSQRRSSSCCAVPRPASPPQHATSEEWCAARANTHTMHIATHTTSTRCGVRTRVACQMSFLPA